MVTCLPSLARQSASLATGPAGVAFGLREDEHHRKAGRAQRFQRAMFAAHVAQREVRRW